MQTLKHMQDELIFWYEKNGRKELPWRNLGGEFYDEYNLDVN